ncbi:MAG TPA: heavy metal-responsive transcriptional regulator [Blastocatellia bacterium]|nr:heavy metal-responsive transcriptional regulator [Blastocatellia bacterium]
MGAMKVNASRAGYSSGQLARLVGVSPDTLRHYERKGILSVPRLANGYRHYPAEALDRLRLVRAALALGFTLDELSDVLGVRARGGAPCGRVRALAAGKLAEAEARLEDLTTLVESLRTLLLEWDRRISTTPPGVAAGLLESLGRTTAQSIGRQRQLGRRQRP